MDASYSQMSQMWSGILFGVSVSIVAALTAVYAARRKTSDPVVKEMAQHNAEELTHLKTSLDQQHALIQRLLQDLGKQQAEIEGQRSEITTLRNQVAELQQENARLRAMNEVLSQQLLRGRTGSKPQRVSTDLRDALKERFNEDELRTLCSDLSLDYEALSGESKSRKADELVNYYERRGKLDTLIAAVKAARPDVEV